MLEANRRKYLRVALMAVGVIFIVGIYSLIMIWPAVAALAANSVCGSPQ